MRELTLRLPLLLLPPAPLLLFAPLLLLVDRSCMPLLLWQLKFSLDDFPNVTVLVLDEMRLLTV